MKRKTIAILAVILAVLVGAGIYMFIRISHQSANRELYANIIKRMQEGGQVHRLESEFEHLLRRPHLQAQIRNNVNILGAFTLMRKNEINYLEKAREYFNRVKLTGQAYDVRDFVAFGHGQCLLKLGGKEPSRELLEEAAARFHEVLEIERSPFRVQAQFFHYQCRYRLGQNDFLSSVNDVFLDQLKTGHASFYPEMLFMAADAGLRSGEREKGLDRLKMLYMEHPGSSWGEKAGERLKAEAAIQMAEYPAISAGQQLELWHRLISVTRGKKAREDLLVEVRAFDRKTKGRLDPVSAMSCQLLLGKVYRSLNRKDSARSHFQTALNSSDPGIRTEAAYNMMRYDRDHKNREFMLKRIANAISAPRYREQAYYSTTLYLSGYPFVRRHQYQQAAWFYEQVVRQGQTESNEYYDHALWRLHWCYYHLGRYGQALDILNRMSRLDEWREYAKYWSAYIMMNRQSGREEEARILLQDLYENAGMNYYGVLAKEILENRFGIRSNPQREPFKAVSMGVLEDDFRSRRFSFLKNNGLFDFAAVELKRYLEEKKISRQENTDYWRPFGDELAKLYFYSGQYIRSGVTIAWVYDRYVLTGASNVPDWFWNIYYPVFYKDTIDRYADKWGVEKNFLYAFIRQESFYEPYVKSYAGAIGVMQIMPATGKEIHKDLSPILRLGPYSVDMLYDPDINIPMGIFHLKQQLYDPLLKAYSPRPGQSSEEVRRMALVLTIAGYNAGSGAARRWLKYTRFANQQEFIDQIDYSETRRYVKLVLKHEYLYKRFRSGVSR
ncbi:MAG: lytic transglycosylase domain-containing protein [Acidobacteriota bacterium]|jgi:tetratricopeptide (TPR) repeat protein|nr:lytic transglycosylase domain-containing protein [Acidobacteriota bacterium]